VINSMHVAFRKRIWVEWRWSSRAVRRRRASSLWNRILPLENHDHATSGARVSLLGGAGEELQGQRQVHKRGKQAEHAQQVPVLLGCLVHRTRWAGSLGSRVHFRSMKGSKHLRRLAGMQHEIWRPKDRMFLRTAGQLEATAGSRLPSA
jgi:hypothetical protein